MIKRGFVIKTLKHIAELQMGYPFRSRLIHSTDGSVSVIQMKDLTDSNEVDCTELVRVDLDQIKSYHFIKAGELIFRSRSQNTTAALFKENQKNTVVAAPLIRIQLKTDQVLPEYLRWFFEQTQIQSWFASHREGTYGGMVNMTTLGNLEVSIPSLEDQNKILTLNDLLQKENEIVNKLTAKRNQYFSEVLIKVAKGEHSS